MQLDPTITVGNLVQLAGTLGAIGLAAWRITSRLARMEMQHAMVWQWFRREHGISDRQAEERDEAA